MLTDEEYIKFKELVYKESGIFFDSTNKVVLESRLNTFMREKNILKANDFYNLLISDDDLFKNFLDKVTTNLTKFFRIEGHFRILKNFVLPKILEKKGLNTNIRIWSAGCSSGEEPYSIAIESLEFMEHNNCSVKIFASDISLENLLIARQGRYKKERVSNVPEKYLRKYFNEIESNKEYVIKDNVKELVTFDYHNLMHTGPQRNMDIIFCRNVLIYFDATSQKLTVNRFYDILEDNGYLFLGHSESLFALETNFKFNKIDDAIVYTKDIKK